MDVSIDRSGIRIVPSPLTVIADGTSWDPRQAELVACIGTIAGRAGTTSRTAFWSLVDSFAGTPPLSAAQDNKLARRGRYITPLLEQGALAQDSCGPVVALASGPVPDWRDWSALLRDRFSELVVARTESAAVELDGAIDVDARELTVSQVEKELSTLLYTERISEVRIECANALPIEIPAGFSARRDGSELLFVWTGSAPSLQVPLVLGATESEARLRVTVEMDSGSVVRSEGIVPASRPSPLSWTAVSEQLSQAFLDAASAYTRGESSHSCELCGETHEFVRAFNCSRHPASFLDEEVELAVPLLPRLCPGERLVVRQEDGAMHVANAGTGPVAWTEDAVLVRTADAWLAVEQPSGRIAELTPTFPGLSTHPVGGLWLVEV